MKATTLAHTLLLALLCLLAACTADGTPDTPVAPGTRTLAPNPGDKPAYITLANTRTDLETGSWQVGDCVTVTYKFFGGNGGEISVVTQTLTCTKVATPGTTTGTAATPAQWNATPAIILVPTGAAHVQPLYDYASQPDPLTATVERISGILAESTTSDTPEVTALGTLTLPLTGALTLPVPEWTRSTALASVHNIAPGATARITTSSSDILEWKNNTPTAVTAHFHLPVADATPDATFKLILSGKPTAYTAVPYAAGEKFTLDARSQAPSTGGGDEQYTCIDGTVSDEQITTTFNTPGITHFTITGTATENVSGALHNLGSYSKKIHLLMPDLKTADTYAFTDCRALASISLPAATGIGDNAFYRCYALASITLPVAKNIGTYAFSGCRALTSITLPAATGIGDNAFSYCNELASITLPVAKNIGTYAFSGCRALTSITLPAATGIGNSAFSYCNELASISLHVAENIGADAFFNCDALTRLELTADRAITVNANTFAGFPNTANLTLVFNSEAALNTIGITVTDATGNDAGKKKVTFKNTVDDNGSDSDSDLSITVKSVKYIMNPL